MAGSKYSFLYDDLDRLYSELGNMPSEIARQLFDLHNDKLNRLNSTLNALRVFVGERIGQLKVSQDFPALAKECEANGVPIEKVKSGWYKSEHFSLYFGGNEITADDYYNEISQRFEAIAEKHAKGNKVHIPEKKLKTTRSIKVTLSDMHVGLEPNPNEKGLFQYIYNKEVFFENLNNVYQNICKELNIYGRFDYLIIDDLGDGLDGFNGQTSRGGHKLEQNMGNVQAFEAYVDGKIWLIEKCIDAGIANKVLVRNVTDDNHSADFGAIANLAIKKILERTYEEDSVKVYNLKKFMEHFIYGDHCFILCHGKDAAFMNRGLPLHLNDKATKLIQDYIDHYKLSNVSKYIHVEKGDLHQATFEVRKGFDYRNYMSFAPPSNWVQMNFGDCYSGYSIQVVPKHGRAIAHTDYILEQITERENHYIMK